MILDDFKTALDRLRTYWFRKQTNGDIFQATPNGRIPPRDSGFGDDLELGSGMMASDSFVRADKAYSVPKALHREDV